MSHSVAGRMPVLAAGAVFACLLLVAAAFHDIDHDEGQYVAAVALMRGGLPYRDFAYLQTPLQPLLFAPLAWVAQGWLVPGLRALNALLCVGAVAMLWLAARGLDASRRAATLAAAGLATSHMLLFAGSVARNDALPLLLHVTGLWLFLSAMRRSDGEGRYLLAGVALAAAASAKISYGLPAAALGGFALLHLRTLGARGVAALALGGVIGALPTAWLWVLAPEAARFGIIDYALTAPVEWRTLNGQAFMLDAPLSAVRLLRFLAEGCALLALLAVGGSMLRRWRRRAPAHLSVALLEVVIVAGLLAAWLPRPVYVQYLGPLLPALLLRFALLLDRPFWRTRAGHALLATAMLAGTLETAAQVARNVSHGSPLAALAGDAHAIGRIMRSQRAAGPIVTLSPERMADSGVALDPRFATGAFLFRSPAATREHSPVTSRNAAAAFAAAPPAAILTGAEASPSPAAPRGLDAALADWAQACGYRATTLPSRAMRLYVRPDATACQPARIVDRPLSTRNRARS